MLNCRDFTHGEDWVKRNVMKFGKEKCKVRGSLPFTSNVWEQIESNFCAKGLDGR